VKIPVSWLREWVDLPPDAPTIAERLTMLGFEVEAIEPAAPPFSGVVVAEITRAEPHPKADRLQVCTVDAGGAQPVQIVCGAANARAGLKSALATIGAQLPGGREITAATLRGVTSAGMLCSAKELGLETGGEGILELPSDAAVGRDLRAALDLNDQSLEIAVTPNRGDVMSVLGLARELAAAGGAALKSPVIAPIPAASTATWPVKIAPGCGVGRIATRVIRGVDNTRPSPAWLAERLRRAGLRSISPVVDVTNFVMLELGQPIHAYDLAKLTAPLAVRLANAGETLQLLDGRQIELAPDVLVIADGAGPVGLAGIMGGERTGIASGSTDLLLEVAWFAPSAITGRARRYGLVTDASQRFERGVDPQGPARAVERATALICELVGGAPGPLQQLEEADQLPKAANLLLRAKQLRRLLGTDVPTAAVESRLRSLGMSVQRGDAQWQVQAPSWRFDISLEADLIEEVARLGGLSAIPEQAYSGQRRLAALPEGQLSERTILQLLAARGFHESISLAFVDPQLQARLLGRYAPLALLNPMTSSQAVMRASLWPGLLAAARENLRRQQERVRLIEIGTRFERRPDGTVAEQKMIAGLAIGARLPEQWGVGREAEDFFDLKGDVAALLALGGPEVVHRFEATDQVPCLHPGRAARILRDGAPIGLIGELHPGLLAELDLTYAPVLFELDFAAISTVPAAQARALSPYPQIRRDLSFTVDAAQPFERIAERVSVAASTGLKELRVFDIYQGKGVESGRRSVALGLILQDLTRTLTDEDADRIVAAVINELKTSLGARIRE
jgi:phenylalanyl-tRNA synthetase beta chain